MGSQLTCDVHDLCQSTARRFLGRGEQFQLASADAFFAYLLRTGKHLGVAAREHKPYPKLKRVRSTRSESPMAIVSTTQFAATTQLQKDRCGKEQCAGSPEWVEGEVFHSHGEKMMIVPLHDL